MRIILINLDEDRLRLQRTTQRLDELGLSWERLSAIHWRDLTSSHQSLVDHKEQVRQGVRVTPGDIGCWISHRLAHEKVVHGPNDMALILEDDLCIKDDLPTVLQQIERGEAGDFDIIRLHRVKVRRKYVPLRKMKGGRSLGLMYPPDSGALAYVITRRGAQILMEKIPRMVLYADHQLYEYWTHGLIPYSIDPPLVSHDDRGLSSRESCKVFHHEPSSLWPLSSQPSSMLPSQFLRRKWHQLCKKYHRCVDFYTILKEHTKSSHHSTSASKATSSSDATSGFTSKEPPASKGPS